MKLLWICTQIKTPTFVDIGRCNMDGLCNINIELTSRCNKSCKICGRRKREQEDPSVKETYGDIDFDLLPIIEKQLPSNIVVQLHNNGEPLMYPYFGDAVKIFKRQISSIDTNGKLILYKMNEIIDNLDTMAISVIEEDPESEEQMDLIHSFLTIKGKWKPYVVLRLNGNVDRDKYAVFGVPIATRNLHSPMGSYDYTKRVTIPEIGICHEFLSHLSIDRNGTVSICVRFDPEGKGILGNIKDQSLEEMWSSNKRLEWLKLHRLGRRKEIPLCSKCDYWGIPTGW